MLETTQYLLGIGSGVLVGFVLGLVGGGGSMLAIPLMVYLVGVADSHVAIGTSAVAVAVSALTGLFSHLRRGTVHWPCALVFAAAGTTGAFAGSSLGKVVDSEELLLLLAFVMILIGVLMLRRRGHQSSTCAPFSRGIAPKLISYGVGSGLVAGFFGIGGGFLIVPGLIAATGMPIVNAVGSSLVAVSAFSLTTATNYASDGFINWPLASVFIIGGAIGSVLGADVAKRLSGSHDRLTTTFAILIFTVAAYMIWKSTAAF
jgi:uncharacterized membrane protein YfcA